MFLFAIVAAQGSGDSPSGGLIFRLRRFFSRPLHEKSRSIYARWRRFFKSTPFPVWLPFGAWFIGRDDVIGRTLTSDCFESAERAFVQRFLQPGMTVLDIGAHHGFYTLLTSSIVGTKGRVFAFEPSPRERNALRLNVLLNRRKNVSIQPFALSDSSRQSEMYVVQGGETGFDSLRRPAVLAATTTVTVAVTTLDHLMEKQLIRHPDFIKLDVEGGELSVLNGARKLLAGHRRPVIQVEVEDARTQPWGYPAKEIVAALDVLGYEWFQPERDGRLVPLCPEREQFQANLVAVPNERRGEVLSRTN